MGRREEQNEPEETPDLIRDGLLVFYDPNMVQFIERIEDGEERWHAIGFVPGSLLLFLTGVQHGSERIQAVRIISARRATNAERKTYDEANP